MAQFINPLTDTGFKIIFGKEHVSNEILRAFLNVLFADDPMLSNITSVEYLPSERVREWNDGKSLLYDIHCLTSTGHRFILEMQLNAQVFFLKRALYYICRGIAEQGYRGSMHLRDRIDIGMGKYRDMMQGNGPAGATDGMETAEGKGGGDFWDYDFIPVIGVFFSNFFISGLERKLVTFSRMVDSDTRRPIGDFLQAVFIQLPAFTKTQQECSTLFDQWIYNLKNMSSMETMAFTSHQDIFNRLAKVANLATLSPAERMQYDYDLKKARDYHAEMNYARKKAYSEGVREGREAGMEEGRAEGRAEGREEGRAEEKIEIARNLLKMGIAVDNIAKATELDTAFIRSLE